MFQYWTVLEYFIIPVSPNSGIFVLARTWQYCCPIANNTGYVPVSADTPVPVSGRNLMGCGMGPLLVLVSPCFRENVVVTCKIGSFLCSSDNLLQKNVIVFFFGNQISKWRSFEKRAIFYLLFTFFSYKGKVTKIPSAHISLTYMHVFYSPYCLFLTYQF